jgi:hypothetical protein
MDRGCVLKAEIAKKNLHTKKSVSTNNDTLSQHSNVSNTSAFTLVNGQAGDMSYGNQQSHHQSGYPSASPSSTTISFGRPKASTNGIITPMEDRFPISSSSSSGSVNKDYFFTSESYDYYSTPPAEKETDTSSRQQSTSPLSDSSLNEDSVSNELGDSLDLLEYRPPVNISGSRPSLLESPGYEPSSYLEQDAKAINILKPVATTSSNSKSFAPLRSSFPNSSNDRGFSSALFCSDSVLPISGRLPPSLTINTNVPSSSSTMLNSAPVRISNGPSDSVLMPSPQPTFPMSAYPFPSSFQDIHPDFKGHQNQQQVFPNQNQNQQQHHHLQVNHLHVQQHQNQQHNNNVHMNHHSNSSSNAFLLPSPSNSLPPPFGPGFRSLADQNPPCNTLYVGNLPPSTSETELRDLFSRAPGYKRLCFRPRPNGPIVFVEFEDISYAQHALMELHGTLLSNSLKGGIRLSFSKNPLGVRLTNNNNNGSNNGNGNGSNGNGNSSGLTSQSGYFAENRMVFV